MRHLHRTLASVTLALLVTFLTTGSELVAQQAGGSGGRARVLVAEFHTGSGIDEDFGEDLADELREIISDFDLLTSIDEDEIDDTLDEFDLEARGLDLISWRQLAGRMNAQLIIFGEVDPAGASSGNQVEALFVDAQQGEETEVPPARVERGIHDVAAVLRRFTPAVEPSEDLCGVFWLGWMVFMFAILRPVVLRVTPERAAELQGQIQQRIRRIVFWLIPAIILTGLYNMAFHGLLNWTLLTQTGVGHRMLMKLGAAGVLFGIYYPAPFILRAAHARHGTPNASPAEAHDPADCHGNPDPLIKKASAILHMLAFTAGVTAAYLGVGIGG